MSAVAPSPADTRDAVPRPTGPDRAPRGSVARLAADPVATLGAVLALVVVAALLGSTSRIVAALVLAALVVATAARASRVVRRNPFVAAATAMLLVLVGLVVVAYVKPGYLGWRQLAADPFVLPQRAVDVTVGCLLLTAPVLVFVGVLRLAGLRRSSAGTPWRTLVGDSGPDPLAARRAVATVVAGAVLVVGAVCATTPQAFGVTPLSSGSSGPGVYDQGFLVVAVLAGLVALVAAPGLLAVVVVGRRDRAEREVAVHRQAVAAHLHDSVLQTFALIQRNLDDPERIGRLVRTQERELRLWLSGREVDELETTFAGSLRGVADLVEEEHGVVIELDVLDDPPALPAHRPLLEAAREALRNAARHGGGAAIRVLSETTSGPDAVTVVYVRDDGPGFDPDAIAPERRGVRDSIVGRMASAGGEARIDTSPGAGTEIVLTLPVAGATP